MILGYNGRSATTVATPSHPRNAADGGRHAMPEDHPTKLPALVRTKPIPQFSLEVLAKFWIQVERDPVSGCWLWRGLIRTEGYGWWRDFYAHRVAYTVARGPIPDGLTIDHVCGNRACVNPAHLEAVTMTENVVRGHQAKRQTNYPARKRGPERIHRRRERGVCAQCNTPCQTFRCGRCNARERERRAQNGVYQRDSQKHTERAMRRYHAARSLGLCAQCGVPSARARCAACRPGRHR